jgi:protein phosphatase
MRFRVGARTDVGRVRSGNEDSYMVEEPLFAVADGMGGHQGGEVASKLALDTLSRVVRGGDLAETVREANREVFRTAASDPNLAGMGTTLTAILGDGDGFRLAHIGDSRLYLLRGGELSRQTTDHTVVERLVEEGRLTPQEAEMHPQRSILTKALGVDEEIEPDDERVEARPGDRLLLCSDGLTGMIEEAQIASIMTSNEDPQTAADALVEAANEAGGQDNITAIVLDVLEDAAAPPTPAAATPEETTGPTAPVERAPAQAEPRPSRDLTGQGFSAGPRGRAGGGGGGWGRRLVLYLLIPLVVVAAGLWAAKAFWVDRQFYVGATAGHVAVFRGIPSTVAGVDLFTVVQEFPNLDAAAVEEFPEYGGLEDGITADDEADARAIVEEMRGAIEAAEQREQREAPAAGGGG